MTRHHSNNLSVAATTANGSPTYPPSQIQGSPTLMVLNTAGPSLPPPGPNLTTRTTPNTATINAHQPSANQNNTTTIAQAAATDG